MKEIKINLPGFSIAAKVCGDPQKPAILALHGWLDNANSFVPLAPYLQNNFHLIAIDLPGHGHSTHLPEGYNYYFFDGIFIIIELIKALNLKKIHLLGHSMGACLASLVAGVSPHLLNSLYLIEAIGPFSSPPETACSQLATYVNSIIRYRRPPKGYEQFQHAVKARAAKGYVSQEIASILCERGISEKEGRFYWRHDQRLLGPSPLRMTEEQILSCLQNINTATELLVTSEGFIFDAEIMKKRISVVKNIQVKQLQGGHHIHMEQPEIVAQLLTDFFLQHRF